MKKTVKILSIFLALVLTLTAFMIPAAAENAAGASFRMELTPVVGETDTNGVKSEDAGIYKLTMYLTATEKIAGIVLDMNYDESIFVPVDYNMGQIVYEYTCDDTYKNAYYNLLGSLGDTQAYGPTGEPVASRPLYYGGSHAMASKTIKVERKAQGVISFSYQIGNATLMPGKETDEPIVEVYLKLQSGADPNGAKFSFGDGETVLSNGLVSSKSVAYDTSPTLGKFFMTHGSHAQNILDLTSIPTPDYTYTAAPVVTGPTVAKSKAELKFTLTSPTTVADPFTLRVTSVITDADWDAYFANTAVADATTDAIQRLGFVAYRGTEGFDMDTAKAVAQGTATEGYDVAWTDYIQKTSDTADAYFGARLEITSVDTRTDVTYVGVVEYLDANNQTAYAFYDAEQEALLDQNYTTYVQQYVDTYGSDYVA